MLNLFLDMTLILLRRPLQFLSRSEWPTDMPRTANVNGVRGTGLTLNMVTKTNRGFRPRIRYVL